MVCSVTSQKAASSILKPLLDFINCRYFLMIFCLLSFFSLIMPVLASAEIYVRLDDGQVYSVRGYHDNDETIGSSRYRENAIGLIDDIVFENLQGKSAETIASLAGAAETLATVQSIDLEAYNASLENMKRGSDLLNTVNTAGEAVSTVSQTIMSCILTKKPTMKGAAATVIGAGLDAVTFYKGLTSSTKGIVLGVALMEFAQKELIRAYEIKSKMDAGGWVGLDELNELSVSIENARVIGFIGADIAEQAASTDESLKERAYRHLGGLANAAASAIIGQLPSNKYTNAALAATVVWNAAIDAELYANSQELDEKIKATDRKVDNYLADVGKSPVLDPASIDEYLKLAEDKGFKTQDVIDFELAEEKRLRDEKISQDKREAEEKAEQARLAKEEAELKKKQLEEDMARLEKDLNAEAGELDSLTKKLKSAGDINQLKSALDDAKDEYDANRSRRRMLSREVDNYNEAIKQLTGKIKVYKFTIDGREYVPEDIPIYRARVREQEAILNTLVREFDKPGGLKETYDAAKERYKQLVALENMKQEQQAKLEKAQQKFAALEEQLKEEEKKIVQAENDLADKSDYSFLPYLPPVISEEGQFACMAIGCEDGNFGISPIELDRKQNETIVADVPSVSPPSSQNLFSVPLFMDKFRQLPLYVNSERVDPDAIINAIFGDSYRIADWTEFKAAYLSDPQEFERQWTLGLGTEEEADPVYTSDYGANPRVNSVSMTINGAYNTGGRILYNGKYFFRQYSMTYADGSVPGYFAVHDQVGGNDFVMGSWVHNNPSLAIKTDASPDYSFDKTAGPSSQETWNGQVVYWTDFATSLVPLELELNPTLERIESIAIDGPAKIIYRPAGAREMASYFYGKDYMGIAYGDAPNYDTPVSNVDTSGDFGWLVTTPDPELGQYDYMSWGVWQENVSYNPTTGALVNTKEGAPWIAGRLTPANEIPTSSTATYSGSVGGLVNNGLSTQGVSGVANLHADFGNRQLTGQFNNMQTADGNAWKTLNVNAGWNTGVNSISGTVAGDGAAGVVQGNFFGPQAAELGGTWTTTAGAETATGVFRSKKQ